MEKQKVFVFMKFNSFFFGKIISFLRRKKNLYEGQSMNFFLKKTDYFITKVQKMIIFIR